jgi:glycosyltransferase involved in cell wall biosynthesis
MNVLFICNEYPPGKNGGIGSVTRTLANAMVEAGNKVFIAGLYPPGYGQPDYEEDNGIKIWRKRLSLDFGIIRNNYSALDTAILKVLSVIGIMRIDVVRSLLSFNKFLMDIIEKFDVDIIEWPDFNDYFSYLPADFSWPSLPIPLIIKFHGSASYINKQIDVKPDRKIYQIEKTHIERADGLIAVSKKTAKDYGDFYNIRREIITLYNSIDIPNLQYEWSQFPKTIVYVGALSKNKGIYSLLGSWNLIIAKYPQATLRIFGKGKIKPLVKLLTPEIRPSVVFEGFVSRDEIYKAMSNAAAAIFPSYAEGFSIAPLEAMAIGCPVIYTQRASGPELITSGINGFLIDPDNEEEMANTMLYLLLNEKIRKKVSLEGRATIEQRFDIRQSASDHINFYSRVIQQHSKTKYRA